jgi:hypothetical protein
MSLSLTDVRRIVAEVAGEQTPTLEVVAARAEAGSSYTEVILTVRGCSIEPCRIIVGVSREASEAQFRTTVREQLEEHLDHHAETATSDR